jgi:acyl carrier protein
MTASTDTSAYATHLEELREIVADVLEFEPNEVSDTGHFVEDYDADSLRAIEILTRIEKKYGVEIPQSELNDMHDMKAVYRIVAKYAEWKDA